MTLVFWRTLPSKQHSMEKQNFVQLTHKLHSGWYWAPGRWKEGNIDLPCTVLDAFTYININIAVDRIYSQSPWGLPFVDGYVSS